MTGLLKQAIAKAMAVAIIVTLMVTFMERKDRGSGG